MICWGFRLQDGGQGEKKILSLTANLIAIIVIIKVRGYDNYNKRRGFDLPDFYGDRLFYIS